jgi:hypothetical protein
MQPNEKPTFPEDLFRNAITRSLTGNGRQLNGDASKMSPHDIAAHYSSTIESVLTAIAPQQRYFFILLLKITKSGVQGVLQKSIFSCFFDDFFQK